MVDKTWYKKVGFCPSCQSRLLAITPASYSRYHVETLQKIGLHFADILNAHLWTKTSFNSNKLVQVMAWRCTCDKPLPEPMSTKMSDTLWRHWPTVTVQTCRTFQARYYKIPPSEIMPICAFVNTNATNLCFILVDSYRVNPLLTMLCNQIAQGHWYRQTTNISRTLEGNKIVDHSDVDGAAPVTAPTTSSFST